MQGHSDAGAPGEDHHRSEWEQHGSDHALQQDAQDRHRDPSLEISQ